MRKENPARYSSAVGEALMHCQFRMKYCHNVFDDELAREGMLTLLLEAAHNYEITIGEIGFDSNHVHFMADIGMYKREEVAKLLRGYTGKKFFEYFPDIKQQCFWGSGLWNPAYYIANPKNLENTIKYIKKQKYGVWGIGKQQTTLTSFAARHEMPPVFNRWYFNRIFFIAQVLQ